MAKRKSSQLSSTLWSYIAVLAVAFAVGFLFSDATKIVARANTFLLGSIFFLSALKINMRDVAKAFRDVRMIVLTNLLMLVIFPIVVYAVALVLVPQFAVALLILAAMPVGMATPVLAELAGGRSDLSLVLAVTTSLLAPFTIPLMLSALAGSAVTIGFWTMALNLLKVILIPFVLANIVKYFWDKRVQSVSHVFGSISRVLLGLLIMATVAEQAVAIRSGLNGTFLWSLVAIFAYFVIIYTVGYFSVFWRDHEDRITVSVSLAQMNFSLAIYLVGAYFSDPNITIPVILSIIPCSIMIIPFAFVMRHRQLLARV